MARDSAEEKRKLRPIILKGHDRPISQIKFNRTGDLLFSASKGKNPTVWFSDTGERAGTYDGHTGAVFSIDVNYDSTRLLTASGDMSTRLWDVNSGAQLFQWNHNVPSRFVNWATGDKLLLNVTDAVMKQFPTIGIYRLADDLSDQSPSPSLLIEGKNKDVKINSALFGPLNETIFANFSDGTVAVYDTETGAVRSQFRAHEKDVTGFKFSWDQYTFVTGSKDNTCKLWDTRSLEKLKEYVSGRPIYDVAISPQTNHLLVAIGQDVGTVTTSGADASQFRVRVFHMVYEQEIASVPGHFAPVNSLAFSPDGKLFASGGEDGFVRLHNLGSCLTEGLTDEIIYPLLD